MTISVSREAEGLAFIKAHGWGATKITPLPQDASTRRYSRLERVKADPGPLTALFMDAPRKRGDRPERGGITQDRSLTQEVSPDKQDRAIGAHRQDGYHIVARIAGADMNAFSAIARALRDAGIHAPEIYAIDFEAGFALIEDLGDNIFARIMNPADDQTGYNGADTRIVKYYKSALDMLVHLQCHFTDGSSIAGYDVALYDETPLLAEALLLPEWYGQLDGLAPFETNAIGAYKSACREMFAKLGPPSTLVLRDFHSENIIWCAERCGLDRLGVIDFQDALIGHDAYDVVSLLEDARREVPAQLQAELLAHYKTEKARLDPAFDIDQFTIDYAILATQRNAKILGIFARLLIRDGKQKYRALLPRVRRYFRQDLARPEAAPMKRWVARYLPMLLEPELC